MATYVLFALPTVALSVVLGVAVGWFVWGQGRREALRAHRDSVRRLAVQHAREIADRDVTVEILRDELAAEASELARLHRVLGKVPSPPPSPPRESARNASVVAVAAARAANGRGAGAHDESSAGGPVLSRRSLRRAVGP